MASFTLSMPDDMRDFVTQQTREGGFSTPTEYLRSLIRADQHRQQQAGSRGLLEKWLLEGGLSRDEEAALPPGTLDRARRNLEGVLLRALSEGTGQPMTSKDWSSLRSTARARLAERKRRRA